VEEVEEDWIYWRGKTEGEGGQHDLLVAMEDNASAFFPVR
jgi:hypothetical protein